MIKYKYKASNKEDKFSVVYRYELEEGGRYFKREPDIVKIFEFMDNH